MCTLSGPGLERPPAEDPTHFTVTVESNQDEKTSLHDVQIVGPQGQQEVAEVIEKGEHENEHAVFEVRYTPSVPGQYLITGKANDMNWTTSPLVVHVADPEVDVSQTVVTWPTESLRSNQVAEYKVETRTKKGKIIRNKTTHVTLVVTDVDADSDSDDADSDSEEESSSESSSESSGTSSDLERRRERKEAKLNEKLLRQQQQKRRKRTRQIVRVDDNDDGTYTVRWEPDDHGEKKIVVKVNDEVVESRLVHVKATPFGTHCIAYGDGLSKAEVGATSRFSVETRNKKDQRVYDAGMCV